MAARTRNRATKAPSVAKPTTARGSSAKARPSAKAPRVKSIKPEVRIFVSYSRVHEAAREKLEIHLAPLTRDNVVPWYDGEMEAGDKLTTKISNAIRDSHIFVALLSPEYLHSDWCQKEYRRAMSRRARGLVRVVATIIRPCLWKETPAADLVVLPDGGRTVIEWRSADTAYLNVAQGIGRVVKSVRKDMSVAGATSAIPPKRVKQPTVRKRTPAPDAPGKPVKTKIAAKKTVARKHRPVVR